MPDPTTGPEAPHGPYPPHGPRELGRSGVTVPPLGLGCAPLGNLYRALPEERAQDVLNAAFATGAGYFDTAPHYGVGLSEERLGRALRGRERASLHRVHQGRPPAAAARPGGGGGRRGLRRHPRPRPCTGLQP